MRYGIALPNYGALADAETLAHLARRAEALGVDSIWVSDHLLAPTGVRSIYPYDRRPDAKPGDMGVIEHFYEPLTTLAYLAGHTSRIRLGVSAYIVPYRNPVLTAKQVATLDALSGGRLLLAVGVGWLREEFDALGVPFDGRGRRTDEYLAICRALWMDEVASYAGTVARLPPVRSGPKPRQRPHPPLWVAGNSAAARRRAARIGQGWHAIDLSPEELAPLVDDLRQRLLAAGRLPEEVSVTLRKGILPLTRAPEPPHALYGPRDTIRADVAAYTAAGCDYLVLNLRQARSAATLERALEEVVETLS
ncbi:MAG TPA: LLM class F420-dependent oxidoreductase [Candidatus Nitrosopolaris sp.]|nr:LLM class F420-dependent oxidoreductase [Candidatus Nitrosopolaris sp.]